MTYLDRIALACKAMAGPVETADRTRMAGSDSWVPVLVVAGAAAVAMAAVKAANRLVLAGHTYLVAIIDHRCSMAVMCRKDSISC